jgi:hypothetical protein
MKPTVNSVDRAGEPLDLIAMRAFVDTPSGLKQSTNHYVKSYTK